jgi:superkiller protein 3
MLSKQVSKVSASNLFLGLALFNLKKYDESEAAYKQAIAIEAEERSRKKDKKKSKDPWQGLVNLYEEAKRVDEYIEAAKKLAIIFMDQ